MAEVYIKRLYSRFLHYIDFADPAPAFQCDIPLLSAGNFFREGDNREVVNPRAAVDVGDSLDGLFEADLPRITPHDPPGLGAWLACHRHIPVLQSGIEPLNRCEPTSY